MTEKMKNVKEGCGCHAGCPCGADCICTENNRCSDECRCWENDTDEVTRVKKIAQKFRDKAIEASKTAEENLNLAKYQKAEFENFRKRNVAASEQAFADGKAFVVMSVLPALDSVTEALKIVKNASEREGVEMISKQITTALKDMGLEEIDAKPGVKFDPHIHNAVQAEKVEGKPSGIILEEWQKGYKLGGKVIRPSTVKTSE